MGISFNADEVFQMAMDIERNGEAYYRKAYEIVGDPKVKQVMMRLAEEEKKHYGVFRDLRDSLPSDSTRPTVSDPDGVEGLYLDALVRSRLFNDAEEARRVASSVKGELEALKAALRFEKDTILFFQSMKDLTREDLGRDNIDLLIEEEYRHVIEISAEIKKVVE